MLTSISSKGDLKLRQDEKVLNKALHCKSYFKYSGVITARPDNEGREKLTSVILKCLKAKQVDRYQDNNLISTTAFNPDLEDQVETVELNGKYYNLQIALRTDNVKNQSYVYLGFPLLLNDY